MTIDASTAPAGLDPAEQPWPRILRRYREPDHSRSLFEIAITLVPLVLLWTAMWAALAWSYWLTLLLAVPTAGFILRLFMIQHDCGHGAFFRRREINDWIGRAIGVLTLTPYDCWRQKHNIHHASSGNLAGRGIGDIMTLTTREYLERSWWQRLLYRLYRHPLVMFGVGPAYLFILEHRLPIGEMTDARAWISAMTTNGAIVLAAGIMIWLVGPAAFLMVHVPVIVFAAMIGVWLFYIQHQFEDTVWAEQEEWRFADAALNGSSYYDLPRPLHWITANIGVHHVHHLCSRIPYYRLPQVLRDYPELGRIGRLTLLESLSCVPLVLWDDRARKLISFRQLRERTGAAC